jgi:predicted nucleic acid-binding protein
MLYLDTSVIVAAVTSENSTALAQAWLLEQNSEEMLISEWTVTEFSSALSLKMRTRHLNLDQRAEAMAAFRDLLRESLPIAPIQSEHFRTAARYVDRYQLGLRSGDALHLAITASLGATLYTLDTRLARIGPELGVSAVLLS